MHRILIVAGTGTEFYTELRYIKQRLVASLQCLDVLPAASALLRQQQALEEQPQMPVQSIPTNSNWVRPSARDFAAFKFARFF